MNLLSFLFGGGKKQQQLEDAKQRGAVIIDVRTPGEFSSGHLKGSKNIPLNQIEKQVAQIRKWEKPIIVVCASGMRSAAAKNVLSKQGLEVYNGGSWHSLK